MCEEDARKEELHHLVEDLHDTLYDIAYSKKEDTTEERNQIMRTWHIETETNKFVLLVHSLTQAEITRSYACQ
jgi:predicted NACHT family NTPase